MLLVRLSRMFLVFVGVFAVKTSSGQIYIDLKGSDGKAIQADSAKVWNSFGTFVKFKISPGQIIIQSAMRRLYVSAEGYQPLDTVFKQEPAINSTVNIVLLSLAGPMDEVVVAASKNPIRIARSAVSVSLLKPYLIENRITPDISQVLDQVPGVNVTDGQVNIRSGSGWSYGTGSRVMVTLDGLPMLSPDAGAVQFSFLPVENLQSVEVIKSAGSVLYGSGALNGVINLRSAEPTEKAAATVSVFAGFYDFPRRDGLRWSEKRRGLHGANGFWSQKIKKEGITIQWNTLYDQGYRMNEFNHRARLSAKWMHENAKIAGLKYGISTGIQDGRSGSFLLWESYGLGYTSLDSGFSKNHGTRFHFDPTAEWKRKRAEHRLQMRYLALENRISSDNSSAGDQSNGSSMLYGEYRLRNKSEALHISVTSGVAGFLAETHSPLFGGNRIARNAALFSEVEWDYNRWVVTAGARYEYFSVNDYTKQRPVFRGGANYRLNKASYLRASAGQGFRFPSMAEMFTSTSVGPVTVFANPELRPESGWNAELGLKQGYKAGKFKGYADVSIFMLQLDNMMEFTFSQWSSNFLPPSFGLGFKSLNTGKSRVSGFEIETAAEGNLGKLNLRVLAGYTYTNPVVLQPGLAYATDSNGVVLRFENTRSDSNNLMKYRNRNMFRADFQLSGKNWESGLSLRYADGFANMDAAFITGLVSFFMPGVAEGRAQAASAWIVDLRFAYVPSDKWKLNVQVSNVFNTEFMTRPADLRPPRAFQIQAVRRL